MQHLDKTLRLLTEAGVIKNPKNVLYSQTKDISKQMTTPSKTQGASKGTQIVKELSYITNLSVLWSPTVLWNVRQSFVSNLSVLAAPLI